MTAQSREARMARGDKMLKLFEVQKLGYETISQRFGVSVKVVGDYLREARERREKAKERAE